MEPQLPEDIRRRNRRNIILLAILFMSPIIAAYVLHMTGWQPSKTSNYGELVHPARPLVDINLVDDEGKQKKLSGLRTKWILLLVGKGVCGKVCKDNLYKMRQIHTAQGKHQHRVQRVFLLPRGKEKYLDAEFRKAYPKLGIYTVSSSDLKKISKQMLMDDNQAAKVFDTRDYVYLIDPIGNLMMRYQPGADATGMRKDLGRILRLSQVG